MTYPLQQEDPILTREERHREELERKVWQLENENRRLRSDLKDARAIAEEQIDDDSLWRTAETPKEEKLAQELGRLHMVLKVCA
jgi:hypothetical protein